MSETKASNKRRIIMYLFGILLFLLILLLPLWFFLGGLLIIDHKYYEISATDSGSSPSGFRFLILATHSNEYNPGFISWSYSDSPFQLNLHAHVDVDSEYEELIIQSVNVIYSDGSIKQFVDDEPIRLQLKDPITKTNPKEYTSGGRPEDLKEFHMFKRIITTDLELDFFKHQSCKVQLKGVILDDTGKETPISMSFRFKAVRKRHKVPLNISRNSV